MSNIFRGDTANNLIRITISNNVNFNIVKAIFQCGTLRKEYNNPQFPLNISLTREETKQLQWENYGYLAVENELGEKLTAKGRVYFRAYKEVVRDE